MNEVGPAVGCLRLVAFIILGALISSALSVPRAAAQQSQPAQTSPPVGLEQGKRLFVQNCSPCHGVDATGEEGPNLRGVPARLGDSAVHDILRRGIVGTAMPASTTLSEAQVTQIVAYLRSLEPPKASDESAGDPKRGEALYNSSGCSICHMIAGQGGSIGPELTRIGAMRGAAGLKARLEEPGANLPQMGDNPFANSWTQYLMFRAIEKDGRAVEGMRVGEDSFTIVLKDVHGKFHSLSKPELRSLEKEPGKSFMPSFKDTLSSAQLDDVVAYLMSLKSAQ